MEIAITVDTNDGDYITETNIITEKELKTIKPLIKDISEFKSYKSTYISSATRPSKEITWSHDHNYPSGECLRDDLGEKSPKELYNGHSNEVFEIFDELCPYGEYGFHTIKSINVYPEPVKTKLL